MTTASHAPRGMRGRQRQIGRQLSEVVRHTAGVIRFHFRLRLLADVEPWGGRRLHWFALTDGWYWIEVDGHKLFHHPSNADTGQPSPVDYYVVRLWEDLQEMLPSLLEPVPADLVDHMTSDQDAWYGAGVGDAEASLDWYSSHFMYTSYLAASPRILWWRSVADRDTITVDWRHPTGRGLDCAVPRQGRASVSTELFLRAVEEFDRSADQCDGPAHRGDRGRRTGSGHPARHRAAAPGTPAAFRIPGRRPAARARDGLDGRSRGCRAHLLDANSVSNVISGMSGRLGVPRRGVSVETEGYSWSAIVELGLWTELRDRCTGWLSGMRSVVRRSF
jgi:Family of unknown function (DUF5984)